MAGLISTRGSCASMLSNIRFMVVLGVGLAIAISSPASAALIVDSLHYDGHVRIGATLGVEEHHLETNLSAPAFNIALPATNAALPAPLLSANNLQITSLDLAALAVLDGEFLPRLTIWIQNTNPLDGFEVFDNPLNTSLPFPVRLNLKLYLEGLAANEQLVVHHRYEALNSIIPFNAFTEIAPPSGRGSSADPLILQLGLPASAVNFDFTNGWLKTQLYYDTERVPEPTALVLALMSVAVASAVRRRPLK